MIYLRRPVFQANVSHRAQSDPLSLRRLNKEPGQVLGAFKSCLLALDHQVDLLAVETIVTGNSPVYQGIHRLPQIGRCHPQSCEAVPFGDHTPLPSFAVDISPEHLEELNKWMRHLCRMDKFTYMVETLYGTG